MVILSLLILPSNLNAQDQTRNEFWPELNAYYRLNPTYRLFFMVSPSLSREDNYGDVQVAGHFEMGLFPIFRINGLRRMTLTGSGFFA